MQDLIGFRFEPPAGFIAEESTFGYRPALTKGGSGPSFLVQSRPARAGASLEELTTEILTELAQTLPNLKNASQSEFVFADGGSGVVLAYNFTTKTGELRQYHALRLNQNRLASVLLTVPVSQLNDSNAKGFLAAIASLQAA